MLVPWLKGFLSWSEIPATWLLLSLNVLFFVLTLPVNSLQNSKISPNDITTESHVFNTGVFYHQYLNRQVSEPSGVESYASELAAEPSLPPKEQVYVLGSQGLRDFEFLNRVSSLHFQGDQLQIQKWKNDILDMQESFLAKNSFGFGLHQLNQHTLSWITYQFMHAGWMHLISNMLMLMIFGAAVELLVGSISVLALYLLGGVIAGYAFLNFGVSSWVPMVGASGAVTAVMSAYLVLESKRRISYFYFLSPFPGHFGFIYLPTLLLVPLLFLPDLVSYLTTPEQIGSSVAYIAHLGGCLGGLIIAVLIKLFQRPTIVLFRGSKTSA